MRIFVSVVVCLIFLVGKSNANIGQSVIVTYKKNNEQVRLIGYKKEGFYHFNDNSEKQVTLATLDWPPYISEQQCDKGWVFQLAVSLFHSAGYGIKIRFLPWIRAVREVEQGNIDVLFPEYFIEERAPSDNFANVKRTELLALSKPFPGGNISFVKRKGESDKFSGRLTNMIGEDIAVVRGYQNTPEFDAMMDAGQFNIIEALNDLQQVKLLLAKRVNYIIGDPQVLSSVIKFSNEVPAEKKTTMMAQLEEVSPPIQYNPLYFALSKGAEGWQHLLTDINNEIIKFESHNEFEYLIQHSKTACKQ